MKPGDRFRFKSPLSHQIWGEGVVYEVIENQGRKHKETYIRGLFHDEEYDPGETVYVDGALQYVGMDNAITFGLDDVEMVE